MKLEQFTKHKAFLAIFAINAVIYLLDLCLPQLQLMNRLVLKEMDVFPLPNLAAMINLVTHMFAHANFAHFAGNMFFVSPFALYLERSVGSKKFLAYWMLSGLGAVALFIGSPHLFPWGGLLGASGACSGIMAAACLLPNEDKFVRVIGLLAFLLIFHSQIYSSILGILMQGGVAYVAHVGGMVTGILTLHFLPPAPKKEAA